MYVTRPLYHYQRSPKSLSLPPEGPNSGILVIQDEESETTTCYGSCKNPYLTDLPFPQNNNLFVYFSTGSGTKYRRHSIDEATFIPILNQPLSSNRYYAIKPHGSHKGYAYNLFQLLFDITNILCIGQWLSIFSVFNFLHSSCLLDGSL